MSDQVGAMDIATLTRADVEEFLYREARYADEHRYDEWLAMWDDGEILYWVPCNQDDMDPSSHISITYDDRVHLEGRLYRLKSTAVHSQRPRSRMRRMLSNLEIDRVEAGSIRAGANFTLVTLRYGRQELFAGRYEYVLVPRERGLRIRQKKVLLVNNDGFIGNLTFLL